MPKFLHTLTILICGFGQLGRAQKIDPGHPALLPAPQEIVWGGKFIELSKITVFLPDEVRRVKDHQINSELKELFVANDLSVQSKAPQQITLKLGKVEVPNYWAGQDKEAYRLEADGDGVLITANTEKGLYYGVQTLRQLIVKQDGKTTVAVCKIHDFPAFKVRGLMHDVGRNFQSIEQLKMQIEVMAAYKMNIFHWHFTDHFGWRLESKIYPDLQADSSFGRQVGKFYTQAEFKNMVDFCWVRGIRIIPEFDSPGHSEAFRKGLGIKNMRDPKAKVAMSALISELCTLADQEKMPYIHVGTDEAHAAEERVDGDYLHTIHKAVRDNGREVMGWWKGMMVRGDNKQIQQTWAKSAPSRSNPHIDSRSNYVNHMEALDFAPRMFFQQPCRLPHGDETNLGGILAYWPDIRVDDEKLSLTNSPVLPAMVAYSEAVWKGIPRDRPEFWAKIPPKGSPEYEAFADFENRLAEQRDRFMSGKPFPMIKTHQMEWRLLGPVADGEVPELENGTIKDLYQVPDENGKNGIYRWTKPLYGGAIHLRHFFGFPSHLKTFPKGKEVVWANTFIHSEIYQEIDAWISFNTTSTSDKRAGVAKAGDWSANPICNIWINDERIAPPAWKNPGKMGKELAFTDEIYSSRAPSKIALKKGWNKVLIKSAPTWKWVFSFAPIQHKNGHLTEVPTLEFSISPKLK